MFKNDEKMKTQSRFLGFDDGPIHVAFVGDEKTGTVKWSEVTNKFERDPNGSARFVIWTYCPDDEKFMLLSGGSRLWRAIADAQPTKSGTYRIKRSGVGKNIKYSCEKIGDLQPGQQAVIESTVLAELESVCDWID